METSDHIKVSDYEDVDILDITQDDLTQSQEKKISPYLKRTNVALRHRPGDSRRLRHRIIFFDLLSASISFIGAHYITSIFRDRSRVGTLDIAISSITFIALVVALCFFTQLYRTRISMVPTDERLRVLLVALVAGALASLIDSRSSGYVSFIFATSCTILFVVTDLFFRAYIRNWLKVQRSQGRYHREVILVGTNSDAKAMYDLLRNHPDVGYTVVGVVGDKKEAENFDDIAWCGPKTSIIDSVKKAGATGVVISANALSPYDLRRITNRLINHGIHVHLSAGMYGFDSRRLRQQNFSREPVFYVEGLTLPLFQRAIKRSFDIIFSSIGIIISAPIIGIAAIMIKIEDGGPVFFRQTRVGKNQTSFRCVKLRTMGVDAEQKLEQLKKDNERTGPLFKQENDPRRTKIGKFIEATSLDELPQLFLVLKGTMSLIGPRPALPHEVALFDEELNIRHLVRPGITGLWQVESRDNPLFDAYRRLDIFYVENWSLLLDISIIASTFHVVVARAIKVLSRMTRPGFLRAGVENPEGNARA